MASLKFSIPHRLPQEEATNRIKDLFKHLGETYKGTVSNVEEKWNGNTVNFHFTIQGNDISGMMMVNPNTIDIDADVPFMISLFQGKIKQVIEEQAKHLLT